MANLASSGQLTLDDIIKNRTGAAGTDVSLKDESEAFASGSEVDGNVGQTTARFIRTKGSETRPALEAKSQRQIREIIARQDEQAEKNCI